jgi:hypothetical protein
MNKMEQIEDLRRSWVDCYDRAAALEKENDSLKSVLDLIKKSTRKSNNPAYKRIYQKLIEEIARQLPKQDEELKWAREVEADMLAEWSKVLQS